MEDNLALVKKDVEMKEIEVKLTSEMRDIEESFETKLKVIESEAENVKKDYELKLKDIFQDNMLLKHEIDKLKLEGSMIEKQNQRDREESERRLTEIKEVS
jgi:hypothetical protein